MAAFHRCPLCGTSVKLQNLSQHASRAHPGKKIDWDLTEAEREAARRSPRRTPVLGRRERWLYPVGALVIVVGIILGVVILAPPPSSQGPSVAPGFTLPSSDGGNIRLGDLRGSVILLDFMDTDCHFCQEETAGVLTPLHRTYGAQVVFLSVDVGFIGPADTMDDIRNFKTVYGATWTYLLDDGSVAPMYEVTSTPTTFILMPDLTVHSHYRGSTSASVLSSALDAALGGG
ncbi:MAG: peroxiredoxin family protein [Thermoplasmata archaeon]